MFCLLIGDFELDGSYTFVRVVGSLSVVLLHVSVVGVCGDVDVAVWCSVCVGEDVSVGVGGIVCIVVCVVDLIGISVVVGVVGGEILEEDCLSKKEISGVLTESLVGLHLHALECVSVELLSILCEVALSESVKVQPLELHVSELSIEWDSPCLSFNLEPQSLDLPSTIATYKGEMFEFVALLNMVCVLSQKGKSLLC